MKTPSFNYPLRTRNTFGLEVNAYQFIDIEAEDEVLNYAGEYLSAHPYFVIGGGSNLLFLKDYEGILLHSSIKYLTVVTESSADVVVRVGSGMQWDEFVALCVDRNWRGIECLSLIPGDVGAAAVQNIGAYGEEISNHIEEVGGIDLANGQRRTFTRQECLYDYRDSIFKQTLRGQYFITWVSFRLRKSPTLSWSDITYKALSDSLSELGQEVSLCKVREAVIRLREGKLPNPEILGNVGSFFMNPIIDRSHGEMLRTAYSDMPLYEQANKAKVKTSAAWLIEKCGWKGRAMGRAAVYDKQPLVLVNTGDATASEIVALAEAIQKDVWKQFAIRLIPEVNYIS